MTTMPQAPGVGATQNEHLETLSGYQYGRHDSSAANAAVQRSLSEAVVRHISELKGEPEWMRDLHLKAFRLFGKKPMPAWDTELDKINFDNIEYSVRSTERQAQTWDDLPEDVKNTYDRLGIPEAEKARLVAGVATQYEFEVVYHNTNQELERQDIIFLDTDTALREHPEIFKRHFVSTVPAGDSKSAALNIAAWSGGSFIYMPKGIHIPIPSQAYFRINTENMGQFERALIIVDEDTYVHYVEGYTAPIHSSDSLHSAVVEIIIEKDTRCRYTTIQNRSNNAYNLVTRRVICEEGAAIEWIDGNVGSKATMKHPAVYLMGKHVCGEILSIAFAGEKRHQDAGPKMVHCAPRTPLSIISESVARGDGRASCRGLVKVDVEVHYPAPSVKYGALPVGTVPRSDTYLYVDVHEDNVSIAYEVTISKVSDNQLFYPMSRGMEEDGAMTTIVRGSVEPIVKEPPMEYALELNRPIELQVESVAGRYRPRNETDKRKKG